MNYNSYDLFLSIYIKHNFSLLNSRPLLSMSLVRISACIPIFCQGLFRVAGSSSKVKKLKVCMSVVLINNAHNMLSNNNKLVLSCYSFWFFFSLKTKYQLKENKKTMYHILVRIQEVISLQ